MAKETFENLIPGPGRPAEKVLHQNVTLLQGLYTVVTFLILVFGPLIAGYLQVQRIEWILHNHIERGGHTWANGRLDKLEADAHASDIWRARMETKVDAILDRLDVKMEWKGK